MSGGAMPQRKDFATTKEYFDAIVAWRQSQNNRFQDEDSDEEEDEGPTCTVCQHTVKDEDIYFECDQCRYRFHEACICKWFRKPVLSVNADTGEEFESGTHNECPNCRHQYNTDTIIQICGTTPEENTHKLVAALVHGDDAIIRKCLRHPIVFDMDLEDDEQMLIDGSNNLKPGLPDSEFADEIENSKVLTVCGVFRPKWLRKLLDLFQQELSSHGTRYAFVSLSAGFPVLHCMLWNCMTDEITQLFQMVDGLTKQQLVDRALNFVCEIIGRPRHTTRRFIRSADALLKEMSTIPARDRRTRRQLARGDPSTVEGVTELAYQLKQILRVREYRGRKIVTAFYSENAKAFDLLKVFIQHNAPLELIDPVHLLRNKPDNVALLTYFAQLDQRHSNFAAEAGGLNYQTILQTAIEKPVHRNIVKIVKICLRNGATYRKGLPSNVPHKAKLARLLGQRRSARTTNVRDL
jgi:hypothetical protein